MRKTASLLFILKVVKAPLSIITLSLTAKYFGVSLEKDVWLLAFSFVIMIDLAIWGPINETFRTKFVTIKESDSQVKALEQTRSLLFYIFLGSLVIVGVIELFAPFVSKLIAPNFTDAELQILITMLRWVAPLLLVNQFMLLGNSILNAYEIFYVPEIATFVSQLTNIIMLILLAPHIGIYSLLLSTVLSTLFQIAFIIFYFRKLNIPLFKFQTFKWSDFWYFFIFAIPFFIPYFFGQINGVIEKSIASTLGTGIVSTIDYARRVPDVISGVLISIVLTIVVPLLTKDFVRKDKDSFNANFISSFQLGLFLLVAFICFMITGAPYVNTLLYGNRTISQHSMSEIIELSIYYAVTLIAIFLYILFGMCMMAIGKSRLYAGLGAVAQIIVIVLNVLLVKHFGIYIFPISIFIAHFLSAIVMGHNYPYEKMLVVSEFVRYILYGLVLSLCVYYSFLFVSTISIFDNIIIKLISIGIIQIIFMILLGFLFKISELFILFQKIKARFIR
ncbi:MULTISPECIES: lipid II flippase MurJ [Sphingobacterium]|uniref:lipid II flippase MurJ n=1 Tax=Sphingobacterium TaxID=28453 RepID=UPI00257CA742|nr:MULTISPECIES: lipid II flippase MurJ [Sphingobacterium]